MRTVPGSTTSGCAGGWAQCMDALWSGDGLSLWCGAASFQRIHIGGSCSTWVQHPCRAGSKNDREWKVAPWAVGEGASELGPKPSPNPSPNPNPIEPSPWPVATPPLIYKGPWLLCHELSYILNWYMQRYVRACYQVMHVAHAARGTYS